VIDFNRSEFELVDFAPILGLFLGIFLREIGVSLAQRPEERDAMRRRGAGWTHGSMLRQKGEILRNCEARNCGPKRRAQM
jgi:hypothetical protein